jgi:hypothetical protein
MAVGQGLVPVKLRKGKGWTKPAILDDPLPDTFEKTGKERRHMVGHGECPLAYGFKELVDILAVERV